MAGLSDIERRGRQLVVSRHYAGDGRWGARDGSRVFMGWSLRKHRPVGEQWFRSKGKNATLVHAGRYQLVGYHHETDTTARLTVWMCGAQCFSEVELVPEPREVCSKCLIAMQSKTTTTII